MFRRTVNFLRGSAQLQVKGPFPERFLNLCAQNGVPFWDVRWEDTHTLTLRVSRAGLGRTKGLGERAVCTVEELGRRGAPALLARFRRRYAFWAGLVFAVLAVTVLSQFLFTVEVEGNEKVPTAEILTAAWREGVRPGAFGPAIDEWETGYAIRRHLPSVSWLAVNLNGTRATVVVREAVPKPELVDDSRCGDIVARCDGLILDMETTGGQAVHQAGEAVMAGEVLIRGDMEMAVPLYSERVPEHIQVRASGSVRARTWRTLSAKLPLTAAVKDYTGAEEHRWSLVFLGRPIEFFRKSGISGARYDRIIMVNCFLQPEDGQPLLALRRETLREYTLLEQRLKPDAAEELLRQRLDCALTELVGEGEVVSREFTPAVEDGVLTVTLRAECREEIGRFVPWT